MPSKNAAESNTINVRVQPRASRNCVSGYRGGILCVSVTALPQDGRANAALLELLAGALGIAKSRLGIVRGHTSRTKAVAVAGLSGEEIISILESRA